MKLNWSRLLKTICLIHLHLWKKRNKNKQYYLLFLVLVVVVVKFLLFFLRLCFFYQLQMLLSEMKIISSCPCPSVNLVLELMTHLVFSAG